MKIINYMTNLTFKQIKHFTHGQKHIKQYKTKAKLPVISMKWSVFFLCYSH